MHLFYKFSFLNFSRVGTSVESCLHLTWKLFFFTFSLGNCLGNHIFFILVKSAVFFNF